MTLMLRQENRPLNGSTPKPTRRASACPDIAYQSDAAHYIAAMITGLRQISGKAGFDKLVAALDAAYYEAYALVEPKQGADEKTPPPPEPSQS
jgi:proline dehydrogenase